MTIRGAAGYVVTKRAFLLVSGVVSPAPRCRWVCGRLPVDLSGDGAVGRSGESDTPSFVSNKRKSVAPAVWIEQEPRVLGVVFFGSCFEGLLTLCVCVSVCDLAESVVVVCRRRATAAAAAAQAFWTRVRRHRRVESRQLAGGCERRTRQR